MYVINEKDDLTEMLQKLINAESKNLIETNKLHHELVTLILDLKERIEKLEYLYEKK